MNEQPLQIRKHPEGGYLMTCSQRVPQAIDDVFAFFSDAGNLQRITPPFLDFRVTTPQPMEMREGALIDYRLKVHGIPLRWQSRIEVWDPPHRFVDVQVKGPYRHWHHTHAFEGVNDGTLITDQVHYRVPGGALVHWLVVRNDIRRIFAYRQQCMTELFGGP